MKIGVVADTHSYEIPQQLIEDFKKCDCIIHAGDFCSVEELNVFKALKEVDAVFGNMDDGNLRKILPEVKIFEKEGVNIGLYHGEGPSKLVLKFVQERFKNENVNVVVFGHSHHSLNEMIGGVLYFNPGSPNDHITAPYCSYGLLEIKDEKAVGSIIKVEEN